jgi:ubiquinone/menaquinone biosynthesis C-methylase UbiE
VSDAPGYRGVDDHPDAEGLRAMMDDTARWPATQDLRAWERAQLGLVAGQRLLDVGCGLGDAVLALAADLGPDGEVVGIDASAEMIAAAERRATTAVCRTRFAVGDALALDLADDAFDASRSERTLQWLPDPQAAVGEMARVTRPGGLVSLIDSDWSTFDLDVGDDALRRRVRDAMQVTRSRPSTIGAQLADVARRAGLQPVAETQATQTWDGWDPDASPVPLGCFSMASLAEDLVDVGQLAADERDGFVAAGVDAARRGWFSMALTMFGLVARVGG